MVSTGFPSRLLYWMLSVLIALPAATSAASPPLSSPGFSLQQGVVGVSGEAVSSSSFSGASSVSRSIPVSEISSPTFNLRAGVVVAPQLILAVRELDVETDREDENRDTRGEVELEADFEFVGVPAPGDNIFASIDAVPLLRVPAGDFRIRGDRYDYRDRDLKVKIDFRKKRIRIKRKHLDLTGIDRRDGFDVAVSFGTAMGLDSFQPESDEEKENEKEKHGKHRKER